MVNQKFRRMVSTLVVATMIAIGSAVVIPQSAQASVSYCGSGRCTLYLSKSETRALGNGSVPSIPASTPWQIRSSYYSLAYGHRWFAQQYANRGWCSGFTLSIYPWETQGYFGYACNWN